MNNSNELINEDNSNPTSSYERFVMEQLSLNKHMKEVKNGLKKEFMEIQFQKQLKKKEKQGMSLNFQKKLQKEEMLNNLLGIIPRRSSIFPPQKLTSSLKKISSPHELNRNFLKRISLPENDHQNKRNSLTSECRTPTTAQILNEVRLKPILSPTKFNHKPVTIASAGLPTEKHVSLTSPSKKRDFKKIKQERNKSYKSIVNNIENRAKTFVKFGFKTSEIDECQYLKPILDIFWGHYPKGTMSVVDLWGKKNMMKYMDSCKMTKDKLMLSKIASVRQKKSDFMKDSKRFLESSFTTTTEENLSLNKILRKNEIKLYNHFKTFSDPNLTPHIEYGLTRKIPQEVLNNMLTKPEKTAPDFLKGIFINAFPKIFSINNRNDLGSLANTEDTKTLSDEKSLFSGRKNQLNHRKSK